MPDNEPNNNERVLPSEVRGWPARVAMVLCTALMFGGLVGAGYIIYALMKPVGFTGDMYGLEVVAQAMRVLRPLALLAVGFGIAAICFRVRRERDMQVIWCLPLLVCGWGALGVYRDVSDTYQQRFRQSGGLHDERRSVPELLTLIKSSDDSDAIEALLVHGDAGVDALSSVLQDKSVLPHLRSEAAMTLSLSPNERALQALLNGEKTVEEPSVCDEIKVAIDNWHAHKKLRSESL